MDANGVHTGIAVWLVEMPATPVVRFMAPMVPGEELGIGTRIQRDTDVSAPPRSGGLTRVVAPRNLIDLLFPLP
jgi:hypothetical protein